MKTRKKPGAMISEISRITPVIATARQPRPAIAIQLLLVMRCAFPWRRKSSRCADTGAMKNAADAPESRSVTK